MTDRKTHRHFKLYKPFGYLSVFIDDINKEKKLLGALYNFPEETMAIGRLDEKSEGLLLLTTDGQLSAAIRNNNVEKEYYVQVDGIINEQAIENLKTGVEINLQGEKYMTKPCNAKILDTSPDFPKRKPKVRSHIHGPTSWISIILTEGKNRQVRKMTAIVGFPTLRLIRVRIGNVTLNGIRCGEVKEIDGLL